LVYFPACVSRILGVSRSSSYSADQTVAIEQLFAKAGFGTLLPAKLSQLCCGMAFASKGFMDAAERKLEETMRALAAASQGKYPVVVDTSPCASRLIKYASQAGGLHIYDISEFLLEEVVPRLLVRTSSRQIAVHVPCSLKASGKDLALLQIARLCAEDVHISESAPCCGFAGDRGFTHPELTASALVRLREDMPSHCTVGYSSSRTCELGASLHSGINFQSIAYLLHEVSDSQ
jgi:D-lactate dehydrogenase